MRSVLLAVLRGVLLPHHRIQLDVRRLLTPEKGRALEEEMLGNLFFKCHVLQRGTPYQVTDEVRAIGVVIPQPP
jgi:hypothetical protein